MNRHGEGYSVGVLPLALAPLRQAQDRSCSVRMTGLKGIARGGIFEELGSVAGFTAIDVKARTRQFHWRPSALFSIGREGQNSGISLYKIKLDQMDANALSKIFSVLLLLSPNVCAISLKSRLRQ